MFSNDPENEPRIKLDLVRTIKSPINNASGKFGLSVSNSGGYVMIGEPNAGNTGGAYITAI